MTGWLAMTVNQSLKLNSARSVFFSTGVYVILTYQIKNTRFSIFIYEFLFIFFFAKFAQGSGDGLSTVIKSVSYIVFFMLRFGILTTIFFLQSFHTFFFILVQIYLVNKQSTSILKKRDRKKNQQRSMNAC